MAHEQDRHATDTTDDGASQTIPAAPAESSTINIRVNRNVVVLIEEVRKLLVQRAMAGIGPDVSLDIQVPAGAIVEMTLRQWLAQAQAAMEMARCGIPPAPSPAPAPPSKKASKGR